jgi:hypothetical protein
MRRHRHLIAVTLLATALCADRLSVAAPVQRPSAETTGGIIRRLSVNLRRSIVPLRLYQPPAVASKPVPVQVCTPRPTPIAPAIHLSPFDFRLPPPLA